MCRVCVIARSRGRTDGGVLWRWLGEAWRTGVSSAAGQGGKGTSRGTHLVQAHDGGAKGMRKEELGGAEKSETHQLGEKGGGTWEGEREGGKEGECWVGVLFPIGDSLGQCLHSLRLSGHGCDVRESCFVVRKKTKTSRGHEEGKSEAEGEESEEQGGAARESESE
ncbi:hypothetical protein E2C01_090377 [Portunus trituberculatus]|uniref:Uncharacterized protein n=1 Tax=Portunus trituberculatus TaxID=210409 RepID=A0A5B7JQ59_PORTR|nr:hypothetical protein [Portunus trituberculatus]